LIIGHSANGTPLPLETPYAFADGPERTVYLDRLVRCLHMLNYLLLDKRSTCLLLHVHPRHVVSVDREHGQFFEDVLARCGLTPSRIALQLLDASRSSTDPSRLNAGLHNYRRRGYRVCVRVREDILGNVAHGAPDLVRLDAAVLRDAPITPRRGERYGALLANIHALGAEALQDGVARAREVAFARWAGVDLVTGAWARGASSSRPRIDRPQGIDKLRWA
jgi:EAL domain-containing protein (putative c-di-GMP-specific phosphodiesterase class I)